MTRVRVIGCGNPEAGDDAVGLLATRAARASLPSSIDVVEAGIALRVLDLLDGVDAVVVVDAVRAPEGGRVAGELVRVESGQDGFGADLRSSLSSHGLGLSEAVGLAAAMGSLPRVVFLGVEAADLEAGHGLSPAVAETFPLLVDAVIAQALELAGEEGA
jgi:hydrogenase maturation protease